MLVNFACLSNTVKMPTLSRNPLHKRHLILTSTSVIVKIVDIFWYTNLIEVSNQARLNFILSKETNENFIQHFKKKVI